MKRKLIVILFCFILILTIANTSLAWVKLNINNDNSPPDPPRIIVPNNIAVGKWFKIEASVTDSDGDDIYVRFNASILPTLPAYWVGPIPSGTVYKALVNYRGSLGAYILGVQAKDVYEAESEWVYVQFNVTNVRSYNNLFLDLLKNYPFKFPCIN